MTDFRVSTRSTTWTFAWLTVVAVWVLQYFFQQTAAEVLTMYLLMSAYVTYVALGASRRIGENLYLHVSTAIKSNDWPMAISLFAPFAVMPQMNTWDAFVHVMRAPIWMILLMTVSLATLKVMTCGWKSKIQALIDWRGHLDFLFIIAHLYMVMFASYNLTLYTLPQSGPLTEDVLYKVGMEMSVITVAVEPMVCAVFLFMLWNFVRGKYKQDSSAQI